MTDVAKAKKEVKIKAGVVKRLKKDIEYYKKESEQIAEKIEKMKADGRDEYDIKKQNEVLDESKNMIPDCERRYDKSFKELQALLEKHKDLIAQEEEYLAAKELVD